MSSRTFRLATLFTCHLVPLALASALIVGGCSSGDEPEADSGPVADKGNGDNKDTGAPEGPQPYGSPCESKEDCDSKLCFEGYCSKLCRKLADCEAVRSDPDPNKGKGSLGGPCSDDGSCGKGLTCYLGKECLMAFDCGRADKDTIACYPRQYDFRPFTTGHDCSADGRCAQSYRCMGQKGTPDRFCSPSCENDKECPAEMRCATMQTTKGEEETRCMPRKMGHPCEIDDQCGGPLDAEQGCVQDPQGNDYCSKTCKPTETGTCPPFAQCKDVGNNRMMCAYKAGKAYAEGGGQCDPCIHHGEHDGKEYYEQGACVEGGLCLQLSPYTKESSCVAPCGPAGECAAGQACFQTKDKTATFCVPTQTIGGQTAIAPCYPNRN